MADSLTVPTATSFRDMTVDVLDAQRRFLNSALAARGLKVSYTHLIGYAIVQAARSFTMMTHAFRDVDGKPYRVDPQGVHLGIAVDVQKRDGAHALVVPVIKRADAMDFAAFHTAYETLIQKARSNRLVPDDFTGGTITLTNPGTLGTIASVPRLMKGQGSIIATGAIRQIGPAKVMTITSTYDHRVIQGAESGLFLQKLEALLQGEQDLRRGPQSLGFSAKGAGGDDVAPVELDRRTSTTLPARALASLDDLKHVAPRWRS
jgi:2-oxoglutarate dehydrogenase E1 component